MVGGGQLYRRGAIVTRVSVPHGGEKGFLGGAPGCVPSDLVTITSAVFCPYYEQTTCIVDAPQPSFNLFL